MHWFPWQATLILSVASLVMPALAESGTVVEISVHSPSLEGNLLGDSPSRATSIYLPPGYDQNPDARYPTLYLLHDHETDNRSWIEVYDIVTTADTLITNGTIQPLIIVMPDANNAYGGSYYVNSPVTGNWEDFVAKELVTYIDNHYRTIPHPQSRAIAGDTMGGFGALYIATKHPETYRVVYAMEPAAVGFVDINASLVPFTFLAVAKAMSNDAVPASGHWVMAMAAAFSPNPDNPPTYVDLPYESLDNQPHRIDAVWDRWLAHTPLAMIPSHTANLRQLTGIAFDVGNQDMQVKIDDAQAYSQALTNAGIPHHFELYVGAHEGKVATRLQSTVLPYLSNHLKGRED